MMKRIIILDISGMYSSIYDEIYCTIEEYKDKIAQYINQKDKYTCVVITY